MQKVENLKTEWYGWGLCKKCVKFEKITEVQHKKNGVAFVNVEKEKFTLFFDEKLIALFLQRKARHF